MSRRPEPRGEAVRTSADTAPTDITECNGTYAWNHTTLVLALATSGDTTGTGTPTATRSPALVDLDTALCDLEARLLELPLAVLFPGHRAEIPVYASDGFACYPTPRLHRQLRDWAHHDFVAVKIKAGRDHADDDAGVRAARATLGPEVSLMVEANGAYTARPRDRGCLPRPRRQPHHDSADR